MSNSDDDYDAAKDMAGSLEECYRNIRERIARGGPAWMPPHFVDVLPLQPPFPDNVCFCSGIMGKELALSQEDFERVLIMFGGIDPTDRQLTISACADGLHIRIEVARS